MLAYRLRERITLQAPVAEQDAHGEPVHAWHDIGSVWADIVPITGRELFAAQGQQNPVTVKIVLRYQASLMGVLSPALRILHGATVYNIEAVLPRVVDEIHLWCSSGVRRA